MIEPTIGRIVWFRRMGDSPEDEPMAAIITKVHDIHTVNITVFGAENHAPSAGSHVVSMHRVHIWSGEGDRPPPSMAFCEWMPYQKGQAAKTDALEKQIGSGG